MSAVAEKPPLTDRQHEVLFAITSFIEKNGWPPTFRDIGRSLGITSPNGVRCHLGALERKGYIERDEHTSRGIRVLD